ncbi:hypothetical protein KPL71_025132 [Citrus sinensis]|uniref:Uncharacterized protein n=1 Tax=Citrus sinensis TaxID=2711 RepID=A0ACB8IXJ9_CITSI|nr:hypothetical protein KPL71_025132 [Citrus sinensis]
MSGRREREPTVRMVRKNRADPNVYSRKFCGFYCWKRWLCKIYQGARLQILLVMHVTLVFAWLERHQPMRSYILIGDLIADSIEKAGDDVLIRISVLNNPFVLIHENKMKNKNVLKQAIEQISFLKEYRRPLLIVAEDVEMDDVIEFLILDKTCLATQVVTGGFDVKLMPQVLGSCKEEDYMLFLVDAVNQKTLKRDVKSGVNFHKMNITLDNARIAVNAALEEGIVPGGGVALLHASKVLSMFKPKNTYQQIGVEILQNALEAGSAVFELRRKLLGHAVVFNDISLDKAIEFNGFCHHQGRS